MSLEPYRGKRLLFFMFPSGDVCCSMNLLPRYLINCSRTWFFGCHYNSIIYFPFDHVAERASTSMYDKSFPIFVFKFVLSKPITCTNTYTYHIIFTRQILVRITMFSRNTVLYYHSLRYLTMCMQYESFDPLVIVLRKG